MRCWSLRRGEEGTHTWVGKNRRTYVGEVVVVGRRGFTYRRMEARFLSVREGLINTDKSKS